MKLNGLILCLALGPGLVPFVYAGDPKEYNAVVSDMVRALEVAHEGKQPKRLAVVTFINTKQTASQNDFGEYLTESFVSEVNTIRQRYKIFERKRLDAVLKENDFKLSDLVNRDQAQQLGELLPIDVLFSGTYTKLKSYIDINARLIDVVTGEILVSFSGRIQLTSDLLSLFSEEAGNGGGATAKPSALDLCKEKAKALKTKLNDLSTEDKVQAVAAEASRIPFDVECGAVHLDVMYAFKRYKIDNSDYKRFLMNVLDTIPYPAQDERAGEILKYLAKDSVIDGQEWKLALKTIKKTGHYSMTGLLRTVFRGVSTGDDLSALYERIDAYFEAAAAGHIGLPTPITPTTAFFFLAEAVKSDPDTRLAYYSYDRHRRLISMEKKETYKSVNGFLTGLYKRESDRTRKTTELEWIAEYFNAIEDHDKAHEWLFDFVRSYELTGNKTTNEEIKKNFPETDLVHFVSLCRERLSAWALLTPYASQKQDRITFCVRYDVPLPGVIPTMTEAAAILTGQDIDEWKRVTALLELMGDRPKICEEALVKLLDRKSVDQKETLKDAQESAIVILGHIRSIDPRAIDYMIESLAGFDYGLGDKAADALVAIGKSAVPAILRKLNLLTNRDDGLRYKMIKILGRMGKEAVAAKPTLLGLQQKATNKDVKYILEAALQAME